MNYSKAAKKRAKKARAAALPELAETPKRDKNKCFADRVRQQPRDPHPERVVLEARCRVAGLDPTAENMSVVDSAIHSDPVGVAIFLAVSDERSRVSLWKTYCDADMAEDVYFRRILQRPRHAKCGKIEFIPDVLASENAPAPDSRDDDTRDRDAVNAWMHWRGLIGSLPRLEASAVMDAMYQRRSLTADAKVTRDGAILVNALRNLTELATKNR